MYLRHQNNANVVFCDGHVESPTLQFLFTDTSDAALSRWNRDHQPHRERLAHEQTVCEINTVFSWLNLRYSSTFGILAALLLPALSQSKRKAQQIVCVGNLHQLASVVCFLIIDGYPSAFQNTNDESPGTWIGQLERGGLGVAHPESGFYQRGVWLCPSADFHLHVPAKFLTCYGYNAFGVLPIGNLTNMTGLLGHRVRSDCLLRVRGFQFKRYDGNRRLFHWQPFFHATNWLE